MSPEEGGGAARVGPVGLAISRSMGAAWAKSYGVIPDPDLYTRELVMEDRILLLGSDGVFEEVPAQEAMDIVVEKIKNAKSASYLSLKEAANAVIARALEVGSSDNLSCVVVYLLHNEHSDTNAFVSASASVEDQKYSPSPEDR